MTVEERYWDVVDMAAEKVERREGGREKDGRVSCLEEGELGSASPDLEPIRYSARPRTRRDLTVCLCCSD